MPVQNIECQIAQAQIGRFVSGGALSPEAMVQLEGHIGECAACEAFLAERKAALQALLAGDVHAVVELPAESEDPGPQAAALPGTLIARLREQLMRAAAPGEALEAQPDRRATLKPLLLSGALALVLVAMSFVSKNPTSLFGEKALPAAAAAPDSTPAQDVQPTSTESTPPSVATAASQPPPEAAPVSDPAPTTPPPTVEQVQAEPSTKKPATPRPAATRPVRKPARPVPASNPTGSIRVYDANGNPITPGR